MVGEILNEIEDSVASVTLIPGGGGRFEWKVDGELVYSKTETGRYPEMNELKELVYAKLS
jgi:selenoprotein W-related protein